MHAKVFSIQYFRQIPPRVCTLVLFIILELINFPYKGAYTSKLINFPYKGAYTSKLINFPYKGAYTSNNIMKALKCKPSA